MNKIYILLGSNIGDKEAYLIMAIAEIEKRIGLIISRSSIYSTSPWGFESTDNFLNQLVCVESKLNFDLIMKLLLEIESELGRKRNSLVDGYESRTIDLDIIMIDSLTYHSEILNVPHPRMAERKFVLEPLNEVAPELLHPELEVTVSELLSKCTDNEEVYRLNTKK